MSDVIDGNRASAAPAARTTSPSAPRVRTTRKPTTATTARQPPARGSNLLDRIADSLDPRHQTQRETERTSTLFQSQQLILFQSQIQDLNQTVQTLRTQLDNSERRRIRAGHHVDRLRNQMYITSVFHQAQVPQPTPHPPYREPPTVLSLTESSPISQNSDQNRRWEATYRDGGRSSWFGNGGRLNSDDDVVEVRRIPWSPSPRSPAQSPPTSNPE